MSKPSYAQKLLTGHGFRVTDARTAVLQLLALSDKPIAITDMEKYLHKNAVKADQVTIYRMVEAFTRKGMVSRLDFQEGKFRYELAKTDHHHVICEKCGSVEDVKECRIEEMEKTITKKQSYLIRRHSLEFFGLCPKCQE